MKSTRAKRSTADKPNARKPRRKNSKHPAQQVEQRAARSGVEPPRTQVVDDVAATDAASSFMSSKSVWLASFVALGTADFSVLANLSSSSFLVLEGLGAAGGAGLVATSASGLKKTNSFEENLDAANSAAWGAQGLMYLVPSSLGAFELGLGLGLVGSTMQTAVGLMRVQRGLVDSDGSLIRLGLLDVGGGLLWLAWDLVGARHPLFIGAYIVAKVGRETYANRRAFLGFVGSLKDKALSACRAATQALDTAWQAFEDGYDAGFAEPEAVAGPPSALPVGALRLAGQLMPRRP